MIFEPYLRNWDEAWYAEIIRNMADGSGLLVPFWNGHFYFDKPPLYFWLTLPIVKVFGPPAGGGEWQTRTVSIMAGLIVVFLVFLIGKKLFNKTVGVLASLIFLSLGQVAVRFNHGNLDALLVCFFLLTFYFYLLSKNNSIFTVLAGIFLGLGFLIKGWFVGLFPLLWIFSYSIFAEQKLPKKLMSILIFAIISSGWWFLTGIVKFGRPFVDWYLLNPTGGLLAKPFESFSLNYFADLVRDIGFWWILITLGLMKFRQIVHKEKLILVSFLLPAFIFIFSLNFLSEKLGWYNLPAYPLIAIIVGLLGSKLFLYSKKIVTVVVCILFVFQIYWITRIENIYPDRSKIGADLGKYAKEIVPKNEALILDDHDFSAFLYYSSHKVVYVLQKGGGKPGEWWILDYGDLENFLSDNPRTWIVTSNIDNLKNYVEDIPAKNFYNGYWFVKFEKS